MIADAMNAFAPLLKDVLGLRLVQFEAKNGELRFSFEVECDGRFVGFAMNASNIKDLLRHASASFEEIDSRKKAIA